MTRVRMLQCFTTHYKDSRKIDDFDCFVSNLLEYTCAKNYQNRAWFDKVIAKIKWCSFLTTSVYWNSRPDTSDRQRKPKPSFRSTHTAIT